MAEEVLEVLDARCLLEEYGVGESCVMFFTQNRIVVGMVEGIGLKIGVAIVIAVAIAFAGLLLRDFVLFLVGLVALVVAALLLGLTSLIVRRIRKSRVKRLAPEDILKANERNFEIKYSDIVKVKHVSYEKYEGGSRLFLPTLPELTHEIEVATTQGRRVFVLDRRDLDRCFDLLNRFVSEKIEEEN